MANVKIDATYKLLKKIPVNQESRTEVLRHGLKRFNTIRKIKRQSVVDKTFGSIPIKDHKLIKLVCEQVKYGE